MKNNILSAFVILFAVVACLLIIDDISHNSGISHSGADVAKEEIQQNQKNGLATLDLETED